VIFRAGWGHVTQCLTADLPARSSPALVSAATFGCEQRQQSRSPLGRRPAAQRAELLLGGSPEWAPLALGLYSIIEPVRAEVPADDHATLRARARSMPSATASSLSTRPRPGDSGSSRWPSAGTGASAKMVSETAAARA
jgi:hypothetical protein